VSDTPEETIRRLAAALSAESVRLTEALNTLKTIRFNAKDEDIRLLADQAIKHIQPQ